MAGIASAVEFPLIAGLSISGLLVEARLGAGKQSEVFRAQREGKSYAVKVSRQSLTSSDDRWFRREVAILARLHHRSVASIFEVGSVGGRQYVVREYVEGVHLRATLSSRQRIGDTGFAVRIGIQLAEALEALHTAGVVHRDIKPENVIVSPEGVARIIDLGLAKTGQDRAGEEAVGSVAYIAPEQAGLINQPVTGCADLYSLGILLFETVVGRTPFESADPGEVLRHHAATPPPKLRQLAPQTSPALEAIVAKLLQKDPSARYSSGAALAADLQRLDAIDESIAKGHGFRLGEQVVKRPDHGKPFVGREEELQACKRMWAATQRGEGGLLLIEGEPGSGKTRLANEMVAGAGTAARWWTAKCKLNDPLPLAPIRDALASAISLIESLDPDSREASVQSLRKVAGPHAILLGRMFPRLAPLLGDEGAFAQIEREPLYDLIASLFLELSRVGTPSLLFIDDVQWIDSASEQVLLRIAAGCTRHPLAVVAAARDDEKSTARVKQFLSHLSFAPTRVRVAPLSDAESRLLGEKLLGARLSDDCADFLKIRARGNPLLVEHYLFALIEEGVLRPSWGQWLFDLALLKTLELPDDASAVMIRRLEALGAGGRRALGVAALFGMDFNVEMVAVVCGLPRREVAAHVTDAGRLGLIEAVGEQRFALVHDRIREALVADVPGAELRDLHQKMADMLDQARSRFDDDVIYAIARHTQLGWPEQDPPATFARLRAAGEKALDNASAEEAYGFLDLALKLTERPGVGLQVDRPLLLSLVKASYLSNRHSQLVSFAQRALEQTADPYEQTHLLTLVAGTHLTRGENSIAREALERGFQAMRAPYPRATFLNMLGTVRDWVYGYFIMKTGIGFGSAKGRDLERLRAISVLYTFAMVVGVMQARVLEVVQSIFRLFKVAHLIGPSPELARAYGGMAYGMAESKNRELAASYSRRAREVAEQIGDRVEVLRAMSYQAITRDLTWQFRAADETWETVFSNPEQLASMPGMEAPLCVGGRVTSYLLRGYGRKAVEVTVRTLPMLEERQVVGKDSYLKLDLGASYATCGDFANAAQCFAETAGSKRQDYVLALYLERRMKVLVEQQAYDDPELDQIEAQWKGLKLGNTVSMFLRGYFLWVGYIRLAQTLRAKDSNVRAAALLRLRQASAEATKYADRPPLAAHAHIVTAACRWLEGRPDKEIAPLLVEADKIANELDMPAVSFEAHLLRTHMLKASGATAAAAREARCAYSIAEELGCPHWAKRVESETGIAAEVVSTSFTGSLSATAVGTGSISNLRAKQQLDALLQLSAASIGIVDPIEHARRCLFELVKVFGAERALLHLKAADGTLSQMASSDAEGKPLPETAVHSSRVIDEVWKTQRPVIINGQDEAAALGSESIVAQGLRSVMAAPLNIRDRALGVVYLDTSMVRGLFTTGKFELLRALSNHIAVALETARAADLEILRADYARNLEVTAAVQRLFLPATADFANGIASGRGLHHAAEVCSGDWWWAGVTREGRLRLLVGDVTGHGAPSAMVTAMISGAFKSFTELGSDDGEALLMHLNKSLYSSTAGEYGMTLALLEVDPREPKVKIISAAAPPVLLQDLSGKVRGLPAIATHIGTENCELSVQELTVAPGTRFILYSDGLIEQMDEQQRPWGGRNLARVLTATAGSSLNEAVDAVSKAFDTFRGGVKLADDVTLLMVEVGKRPPSNLQAPAEA